MLHASSRPEEEATAGADGSMGIATRTEPANHRWSSVRDEPRLREIILQHFGGAAPRTSSDVARVASLMPVAVDGAVCIGNKPLKCAKDMVRSSSPAGGGNST